MRYNPNQSLYAVRRFIEQKEAFRKANRVLIETIKEEHDIVLNGKKIIGEGLLPVITRRG